MIGILSFRLVQCLAIKSSPDTESNEKPENVLLTIYFTVALFITEKS